LRAALNSEDSAEWLAAAQSEFDTLDSRGTWTLTDLPQGRTAIGTVWVFRKKTDAAGHVERYKCRLCCQGFNQRPGIDYHQTFAPVVHMASVRTILSLATSADMDLSHFDVVAAFLNGEISEEIYIRQPEGFRIPGQEHKVYRLLRGLYGLKQAAFCWNSHFSATLTDLGFLRCDADPCVYIKRAAEGVTILAVWVDDCLVATSPATTLLADLRTSLFDRYQMTDLGELSWFLNMAVTRNRETRTLKLDQSRYTATVLERFGLSDCKPVPTPQALGAPLSAADSPRNAEEEFEMTSIPYRAAVGCLRWLADGTRPDIACPTGEVSRFLAKPGQRHWTAAKRIYRYLRGTASLGISFTATADGELTGYCDASYADDIDTRKSTTGFFFELNKGPISWKSKRQRSVALSTCEGEYMALSDGSKECVWLRRLLSNLDVPLGSTTLFEDNQGAIALVANPLSTRRSKHIDVRYHYIRQCVAEGHIVVTYLQTDDMIADLLTKPLPVATFKRLRDLLLGGLQ
jgi:hypothetical protein